MSTTYEMGNGKISRTCERLAGIVPSWAGPREHDNLSLAIQVTSMTISFYTCVICKNPLLLRVSHFGMS